MKHKPLNGRQTAAFWIEHVLQFGGEHLKPPGTHLAWWQYFCLDTIGVLFLIVILILGSFYIILKFIFKIVQEIMGSTKRLKCE